MNANEVAAVEHLCKVVGVTIFPPAHLGFIRVIQASDVAALQGFSRVVLFVVGALAHASIANREQAFCHALLQRIPLILNDLPGMNQDLRLHKSCPLKLNARRLPDTEPKAAKSGTTLSADRALGSPMPMVFMPPR